MSKKRDNEGCDLNMTPMIDVVFQLIIFFIVTINIADTKDENIQLEFGYHGQEVKTSEQSDTSAVTIDVAMPRAGFPEGRISVGNITIHKENLRTIVRSGRARFGDGFQVWVRGDWRATHGLVRKVMDLCAEEGIGRVTFLAVQGDPGVRTEGQKAFLTNPKMTINQFKRSHPGKQDFRSRPAFERYRARSHAIN